MSGAVSRRLFLRSAAGGAAGMAGWSMLSAQGPAASAAEPGSAPTAKPGAKQAGGVTRAAARIISFGGGWRFGPAVAGGDQPAFDDSALATVTLPHTVAPLSWQDWDPATWERVWVHRKHFDAPAGLGGSRVLLDFAAALTRATITLNGTPVADHFGGYLPFSTEITSHLQPENNVLAMHHARFPRGGQPSRRERHRDRHYTDGSTSSFTITLDNYFSPPDTGNDIIATLPYLNDRRSAIASGTAGKRNQTVYVFYTSAAITAGKTVQAVTLPSGGTIPSGGRISGLHGFALGIGPLSARGVPLSGDDN